MVASPCYTQSCSLGERLTRAVAIGGFMGVGKGTVGRAVANALGRPFVDLDEALRLRWGPIREQFERDGEGLFREREAATLATVLGDPGAPVIATGGGCWAQKPNRDAIAEQALGIVLRASLATCVGRMNGDERPLAGDAGALWATRRAAYADADVHVDADRPLVDVVADVVAAVQRPPYRVRHALGTGAGDALVAPDARWLAEAFAARFAGTAYGFGDPMALRFHPTAAGVGASWLGPIPRGERAKRWPAVMAMIDDLLGRGVTRDDAVVAFGGGATTDAVGLAAALTLRGLPWAALATTVVGAVDASLGGKVAIDRLGKNRVGTFHAPRLSYAAAEWWATTPARARRTGLIEALKVGLVGDPEIVGLMASADPKMAHTDVRLVARAAAAKLAIVARDERDRGERIALNAGHTVGHALEVASGYRLPHAEAVGWGLVAEVRFAAVRGVVTRAWADQVAAWVGPWLGRSAPPRLRPAAVRTAIERDKKRGADTLVLPIPVSLGRWEPVTLTSADRDMLVTCIP